MEKGEDRHSSFQEYHQPSRATLGNAAEALSPWKRMLDRIEEDVSERRTSQFVAEMPRETHLDPALAKDYGFDPGRHDTIAFDLGRLSNDIQLLMDPFVR